MHHDKDKILIRAKDISLIVGILTLAGIIWALYKKPYEWDEAALCVRELKVTVNMQQTDIAVMKSQYSNINENINKLGAKMDRLNRSGRREYP